MESTAELIDYITVYPKYKSISNTLETCPNKFSYQCNVFECDFTKCMEDIKQDKKLSHIQKNTTLGFVDTLQKNQEQFAVKGLGGFILENNPNFQLVILNDSYSEKLENKRFGFCNLTYNNMLKIQNKYVYQSIYNYFKFIIILFELKLIILKGILIKILFP